MNINDLVAAKGLNHSHNRDEIEYIVDSYTSDIISDEKMTEWLKAVYLNGMVFEETIN